MTVEDTQEKMRREGGYSLVCRAGEKGWKRGREEGVLENVMLVNTLTFAKHFQPSSQCVKRQRDLVVWAYAV